MKRRVRRLKVTDFDKTLCKSSIPYATMSLVDRKIMLLIGDILDQLHEQHDVCTALLSDKPAGQFPPIMHFVFGASAGRWHFGESGGARYDAQQYFVEPHPRFVGYRTETRKGLVRNLREGGAWRPEPGYKLLSATVLSAGPWGDAGKSTGDEFLGRLDSICAASSAMASGEVVLRPGEDGNIVTFSPKGLDKRVGANWLIESYTQDAFTAGEIIDWRGSIWVGDSLADLAAAERFVEQGMLIACVGNADRCFEDFVRGQGERGYVAERYFEDGFLECAQWYQHMLQRQDSAAAETAVA